MASLSSTNSGSATLFATLTKRSSSLPYKFHTSNNRLHKLCTTPELQAEAEQHARTTRPYIHSKMLPLLQAFLQTKQQHGSALERELYTTSCTTPTQLLHRLLTKRPLMFMNSYDQFLLHCGHDGAGSEIFDRIGSKHETKNQHEQLTLAHLMSYDEMPLASLLAVSTPTHFINSGGRNNMGRDGQPNSFVRKGVIVGQVGTRFERKQRMEWCHCVVDETQNTTGRGYGSSEGSTTTPSKQLKHDRALLESWAAFYGIPYFPTFAEVVSSIEEHQETKNEPQQQRYVKLSTLGPTAYFDTWVFSKRMEYIAELYLVDANDRAKSQGTQAVCHVVGLGLGVWLINSCQRQLYVDAFGTVLQRLHLPYIKDVYFAYIRDVSTCAGATQGEQVQGPNNQIGPTIHFGRRDPAALDQLTTTATNTGELPLLHTQYAWDGNSYPGNEYWVGRLAASGDPAAACCSTIPELQNPDVNSEHVSGTNIHVVDSSGGEHMSFIQKI